MSRSISSCRNYLVTFDDGYQMSAYVLNESLALEYGDKWERYNKHIDPKRPKRKAVKAVLMSSDPEIRKAQFRDIVENNRKLLGKSALKARRRPKLSVERNKDKKEGHDQ